MCLPPMLSLSCRALFSWARLLLMGGLQSTYMFQLINSLVIYQEDWPWPRLEERRPLGALPGPPRQLQPPLPPLPFRRWIGIVTARNYPQELSLRQELSAALSHPVTH